MMLIGKACDALTDGGIVKGFGKIVRGRRRADIGSKLQVERQALANGALPVVNANHCLEFKRLDQYAVHAQSPVEKEGLIVRERREGGQGCGATLQPSGPAMPSRHAARLRRAPFRWGWRR